MSEERNIEILNNIKEYMQSCIDRGYHKFVYNDLGYDEKCIDIINAIDDLLYLYNQTKKDLKNDIEARDILVQYYYNTKEDIKNIINNHYPDVAVQKILELLERNR